MESRLIYKISEHLSTKVNWIWQDKTEWIYCGLSQDFKSNIVAEHLNNHLSGSSLYFVLTRNDSYELPFKEALTRIKELVDTNRFMVWDIDFTKAMEFNNIGVFRKGACAANTSLLLERL